MQRRRTIAEWRRIGPDSWERAATPSRFSSEASRPVRHRQARWALTAGQSCLLLCVGAPPTVLLTAVNHYFAVAGDDLLAAVPPIMQLSARATRRSENATRRSNARPAPAAVSRRVAGGGRACRGC